MKIEILVSTLNDGIYNININPNFNYLIIHQINNDRDYSIFVSNLLMKNVRYITSNTVGLSKSRNIAIKNSQADYIWIMDDDVVIIDNALDKLLNLINSNLSQDMFILSHSSSLNNQNIDHSHSKINKLSAMSISSIDMFIKKDSLARANIFFNESFGLGTELPSGEEYIFAIEMLNKKMKILKTKDIFSLHPPVSSGMDFFSSDQKLNAKLQMFSFCYGKKTGKLIYLLFIIKKLIPLIKNNKFLSALKIIK